MKTIPRFPPTSHIFDVVGARILETSNMDPSVHPLFELPAGYDGLLPNCDFSDGSPLVYSLSCQIETDFPPEWSPLPRICTTPDIR